MKLKKILVMVGMALLTLGISSCEIEDHFLTPVGNSVTVKKSFSNYSEISVGSGFQLYLKQDGTESVEIQTNENLLPYIESYQKGNMIYFYREENVNFTGNAIVKIYVSAKEINALEATGGSSIRAETDLTSDNLALNFSGGSSLQAEIISKNLLANLSGGSTFDISGKSSSLLINGSGGSIVNGVNHQTDYLTANFSGGSILYMTVNKNLSLSLSGGSIINYYGDGIVVSSINTGGSRVIKK